MDEKLFEKKIKTFAGHIVGGTGKTEKLRALLLFSLNKQCVYCPEIVTIENASLDHKVPYNNNKLRNKRTKETLEQRKLLDQISNLQFVTKECNFLKGNLSDEQFRLLLQFFEIHADIGRILIRRLKASRMIYTRFTRKSN